MVDLSIAKCKRLPEGTIAFLTSLNLSSKSPPPFVTRPINITIPEVSRRLGKRPQHALRGAGAETLNMTFNGYLWVFMDIYGYYVNYMFFMYGKRLHNYGKIHPCLMGKIHYFYGHF